MKKISLSKKTRNIIGHRFGLLLALLGWISVATFVLEPAALAQVSGDWFPTGSLNTPRSGHTATLLPNGKVLVVGGDNSGRSAELYEPVTGTWSVTGSLNTPRYSHSATLLPDGKVVVVGGWNGADLNTAELYDPATGTWSLTGSLHTARSGHSATLLQNGKILVTGGYSDTPYVTNSAELYDPASGTWGVTDSLKTPRVDHTATLLQNGRVLVAGGMLLVDEGSYLSVTAVANTELYDPATGTWSNTGDQNSARFYHTATLLPNGKVLVAGGSYPGPPIGAAPDGAYKLVGLNSAELYDPATGRWSYTGALHTLHAFHTATLLQNGRVLVDAGTDSVFNYPTDQDVTGAAELYDSATGSWGITAPNVAREFHTASLLQNGLVLVAGGDNGGSFLNSAELYDPTAEGVLNSSTFVRQQYSDFLDRDPEAAGLAGWVNALDGGLPRASLIEAFMDSQEFFSKGKFIAQTYLGLLTRDAEYSGFRAWLEVLLAGVSHEQIVQWFLDSDEFTIRFGSSLTNSQFIERMYNNVLLRSADPGELNLWVGQLTSGQMTRAQAALGFLDSDEFQKINASQNEIDVSLLYFSMLQRDPDPGSFAGWIGVLNSGVPLNSVIDVFLNSPEYQAGF